MNFKLFLSLMTVSALQLATEAAAVTPQFSDAENEHWYYLSYPNTGKVIQDMGPGEAMRAENPLPDENSQRWKLVGTQDDFVLVSAIGGYVYKEGPFRTADAQEKAVNFGLLDSNIGNCYMVKYHGDDWGCLNQYGNGTIDGYWNDANDANNAIEFLETINPDEKPDLPGLPRFSNGGEDFWYYISYANGGKVFQDNGAGQPLTTADIKIGKDAQLWKLTGDAENFTLCSKLGNYVIKNGPFRSTADASKAISLTLEKAGNKEFDGFLQINYKGDGWGLMNQYSNGQIDGWYNDPNDQNNALWFVDPSSVSDPLDMSHIKEFTVNGANVFTPSHRATLWYTVPVTLADVENPWMEYALPIGNGEFWAMVYGGIHCEQLQFNDKSVWTGTSKRRGGYQNFGDVFIEDVSDEFDNKAVYDYVRYLDMEEGIAGVRYTDGNGTDYSREYLASYPDKVIAVRLSASAPGKISVRLRLRNNIKKGFVSPEYSAGTASFEGKLDLVNFKAVMKAVPTGGKMTATDEYIEVAGADELLIVLAGGTNFDQNEHSYVFDAGAMSTIIGNRAESAAGKSWNAIRADHTADFATYFSRVKFNLGDADNDIDTKKLVDDYASAAGQGERARMLEELYFNYGRYLLISSSRGMDTPANLQGIWNNSDNPAWQSDIHSNINVQMNYWLAENTNLSEMHMPYLNYIYSMAIDHDEWKEYARRSGQSEGWTCFTQNNIFGHSDYAENYVIANAWYTSHLWQHYRYTLDLDFLRDRALPVMVSCSKFWLERLVEAPDGSLVAPKEWSPEHGPDKEDGTAHAQQLVAELFESTLKAIDELGGDVVDAAFLSELNAKNAKLDRGLAVEKYTGAWGNTCNGIASGTDILREWKFSDYSAGQNGHRHQSHLMAMYPFGTITPESEYFAPAVNSLTLRSDASTGWSLAWRVNLWARALDGNHAHKIIKNALKHSTSYAIKENQGGIYYNLFDSHAPFQIDGNFGYAAGVAEMLVQSYDGKIRLLPALPSAWTKGTAAGLRAIGNFEIDQEWNDNALAKAVVRSFSGQNCIVEYKNIGKASVYDAAGNAVTFTAQGTDCLSFATVAGGSYTIIPEGSAGIDTVLSDEKVEMSIHNGIVTVSAPDAKISVYDFSGMCLMSTNSNTVDLSAYKGSYFIITAVTQKGVSSFKCCI